MTLDKLDEIQRAIAKRFPLIKEPHETAYRLINGFTEGIPGIICEIFGTVLICHDFTREDDDITDKDVLLMMKKIQEILPFITTGMVKKRRSTYKEHRDGKILFGKSLIKKINENGVSYSVDLRMNQDTSFYLDTKNLRNWLRMKLPGKSVLNTFAYTGSLGLAAAMGGADPVIQLDLNRKFLSVAKRSYKLNNKDVVESSFQTADFWSRINQYKKSGQCFDCVILDPPVFSKTPKGTIDVGKNFSKLINKVRPVINDGGYLITISNALFQTGKDHQAELEALCESGYLSIEEIIPVPDDCIGEKDNLAASLPADPAPYNHSTKITILKVKRKDSAA